MKSALFASAALAAAAAPRALMGTVRADMSDPAKVLAELKSAFEAFKSENDAKLNGKADVLIDEKVDRINAAVGDLQAALEKIAAHQAAVQLGGGNQILGADAEYANLYASFFRTGSAEAEVRAKQFAGVRAAMSVGSNPDGGYLAPVEWDRTITEKLKLVSAMRQLATVISISGSGFSKLFNDRNTASGWVGETDARGATGQAQFGSVTWSSGELYAKPTTTQSLLEDALVDVAAWLAGEVESEFAYQEGIAFVNGNGTNKPKGFLQHVAGDHPWGAIPEVKSGNAALITSDGLIDLTHDLPTERTQNASFVMNRKTQGAVRKLKNGQGDYIWQPSLQAGLPPTLLEFPVRELPAMPDVAANAIPIAFGDWKRGYLIVDRIGVQILRDPYSNKPYVEFYTRKRVGGKVSDPTALRFHKVSA